MSDSNTRPDKHLYSYKQALSQPYWIQKINDQFSLKSPIRFSRLVYGGLVFGLFWLLLSQLLPFTAFGFRGMVACLLASYLSGILAETIVDGKTIILYLVDYLAFYVRYGISQDRIYINKGQVYDQLNIMTKGGDKYVR